MIYQSIHDVPDDVYKFMRKIAQNYYDGNISGGCSDLMDEEIALVNPNNRQDFLDTFNWMNCGEIDPTKSDQVNETFESIGDFCVFWIYLKLVDASYNKIHGIVPKEEPKLPPEPEPLPARDSEDWTYSLADYLD